jgi:hypothetical protein
MISKDDMYGVDGAALDFLASLCNLFWRNMATNEVAIII